VEDGAIVCPYHGWAFARDGACVRLPQAHEPERNRPGRGPTAHRCQERYGYAWVCLDEPLLAIPLIREAEDKRFRQIHEFHEPWAAAGLRIMENSFDTAHFSFVHRGTFGVPDDPRPAPSTIEHADWGFTMRSEAVVANQGVSKEILRDANERTVRRIEGRWHLPFFRASRIDCPNGITHVLCTGATPVDDRVSQIAHWVYRSDTEEEAPAEKVIAFDRAATEEDRRVLETTTWDVPLSTGEELHMPADKPGLEMRRRVAALLTQHGEAEARLPAMA
jgi:phenylpropionate dioxygenase-like ring-hydroxylating dioxygenase large terminal subunit